MIFLSKRLSLKESPTPSFPLILTTGFAVFSMFFGSGNLVFPLIVGKISGDQFTWTTLGFLISGTLVPFLGLWSVILDKGSLDTFFGRLGFRAEVFLPLIMLALLGPFGVIPRCITVAYGGFSIIFEGVPLGVFSFFFCVLTYGAVNHTQKLIEILGGLMTPFLLNSVVTRYCPILQYI